MKKALSLLLAVLMLVSLFGTMAFADDDVIEEEVVAEEPVAEEPVAEEPAAEEPAPADEIAGDGAEEAAAAVEEYTDEGSFEASDAYAPADLKAMGVKEDAIWEDGKYVVDKVEVDGKVVGTTWADIPTKHGAKANVWIKLCKMEDGKQVFGTPDLVPVEIPHNWGPWYKVGDQEATCTTGGMIHSERKCQGYGNPGDGKCDAIEKTEPTYLPMQEHCYVVDKTYSVDNPQLAMYAEDDSAIVVAPTCQADGKGHWVCKNCGALAPDTFMKDGLGWVSGEYTIYRYVKDANTGTLRLFNPATDTWKDLESKYHAWGDWTTIKEATCVTNGTKAHYCWLCPKEQTEEIPAYNHKLSNGKSAIKFDHIERVSCTQYVEYWVCTREGCKGALDGTNLAGWRGATDPTDVATTRKTLYRNDLIKVLPTIEQFTAADRNSCFLYTTSYKTDYNTEHFDHHRYGLDWNLVFGPSCCREGVWMRMCKECGHVDTKPEPALDPIYDTVVHTRVQDVVVNGTTTKVYYHFVRCLRDTCHAENAEPVFGKLAIPDTDPRYFTQENVMNPEQVAIVDHDWDDWICYVKPVEGGTEGQWTRTCKYMAADAGDVNCLAHEDFSGTQAQFDAMVNPPHPVLKAGLIWETENNKPVCKLYEMGVVKTDFTGIYTETDGKKYFVDKGIMCSDANGLAEFGGTWYFLANGCIQEQYSGLALYDDEWFYLENGKLDLNTNGLVDHDGSKFLVGVGRIQYEYTGLYLEDNVWYFIGSGQVATYYTGLVEYDGELFYVEKGVLVPYNGQAEYNGVMYTVVNGQAA